MENLCYFLETNFSDLCELFLYISIAGFIIYLPFRSHWGKIFSFSNSMVFYACLTSLDKGTQPFVVCDG